MRGTSKASLTAVQQRWEPILLAAGGDALTLAAEMFALVDALDGSGRLRRVLTDPSLQPGVKGSVVERLLASADPRTVTAVRELVAARWSAARDLAEAASRLAMNAALAAAEAAGTLRDVEEQVFIVSSAFVGQRELRRTLHDPTVPAAGRADLVDEIIGPGVEPATRLLLRRAAAAPRGRRFVARLGDIIDLIAVRSNRRVATVTVAAPLDEAQRGRLSAVLARTLDREVQIDIIVDPLMLGGVRVQAGSDVIDATVLARLGEARRRLAG